ncbi:MAG: hypothetical protein E7455_00405 [Ruminococcaceae bacterium]|nr:hypothetical protein [Oscillospiraceae bacterium]
MNLSKLRGWRPNYLAVAFLMPFVGMLILMICVGATPFGHRSLLYSDMWHQYFPFFKAYRNALLSGESLLFSWNVGMGMDYLGLISYYLASPLYLLSVLLPDSWVLPYFSLLVPVKLGLASLFFAIFLKKLFGKNDFSIALFGSFYGLCAWALGYQWNIMWLDTFALLPLVALGTVSLLRDKKFILYTISLALSIFINYYIGFFTCIFVLLLFICYQICRCRSVKAFFLDLGRIALFSALAIGMTAILELPALAALGKTYSSVNSFPEGFQLNLVDYELCTPAREAWEAFKAAKEAGEPTFILWFQAVGESFAPVLNGMGQVAGNLSGGAVPTFMEGLPNVYTGVSTLLLAFLFLLAGKVKLRDKICCVVLILFFMFSFVIRQLDYIWHGFHFTNQIPYRFSFILSFVMLYMAYRAYLLRHRFRPVHFMIAGILTVNVLLLSQYVELIPDAVNALGELLENVGQALSASIAGNEALAQSALAVVDSLYSAYGDTYVFLVYNGVFFALCMLILLYPRLHRGAVKDATWEQKKNLARMRRSRFQLSTGLLCLVMALELVMNVVNFGVNFSYTDITNYPQGTEYTASMIRYMKEREDELFYRTETTRTQTLNDGALNDYNGISTFTSSANVNVTRFMTALGFAAQDNWNRYCYEESSPVANLFLNLKYMLERSAQVEENPYFDNVHHYGDVYLLENNAYLPLGFLAESDLADAQLLFDSTNAFYNQNLLFSAATGLVEDVWVNTPTHWLEIEGEGVDIIVETQSGYCSYYVPEGYGTLIYKYTVEEEGFLCLDAKMYAGNSFYVNLNGEYLFSESVQLPQTFSVSQVRPGDVVELRISCAPGEDSSIHIQSAMLDDTLFREGYEILNASTMDITKFSTTEVFGNIICDRDGLLYTSIPDDGNWYVYVDGERAEQVTVADAMVGVYLTEGYHDIMFVYHNDAFTYGALISVVCLLVFLALIYLSDRQKWNERVLKIYHKIKEK